MGTLMSNGRKVLMVFSRDGKLCTKTYTSDGKLAWELEGDMLLKFAVDVAKGTTLFMIDDSTEVTANDDYKAGDYLYFSKGTFHPTRVRFRKADKNVQNYYSEVRFLQGLDDSKLSDLSSMFGGWNSAPEGCGLVKLIDFSHCDTSRVSDIRMLCIRCSNLRTIDLSNFNTSNVTNIGYMVGYCGSLESIDVSSFDTSKVTNMNGAFSVCGSLESIDVSSFDTSKVTGFREMFRYDGKLASLDVSNFDTSKVTDMRSMFYYCTSLTNLIFGSKWGTQTSTAANALTLDLSYLGSKYSYKLTDDTYNSMLTMYDRASNGLTTMTIKFSTKHNLPDGFAEKMSALGYTITLV